MSKKPLKICLATSELAPLAKTGGLADVCAALSDFLHRSGHDVRVVLPRYSIIDGQGLDILPVDYLQRIPMRIGHREGHFSIDTVVLPGTRLMIYLVRCPELYDRPAIYTSNADEYLRFVLLARAAIEMCQQMGFAPDVFHCHDWHAALVPLYLKTAYAWDRLFSNTRSVLTIHNIAYQGVFNASILPDLAFEGARHLLHQDDLALGRINFLKTGVLHADMLTTVSPTYAREIQDGRYGMGLQELLRMRRDTLVGILNGVDYREWNPETDPLIPVRYSRTRLHGKSLCKRELMKELGLTGGIVQPLVGMVTRLTSQKGIDLIQKVLPPLMQKRSFSLAVLGSGEARYERFFSWLQDSYADRVHFWRGFNERLAHRIEAGSDMFLMPSRFEPCGLNQMYSLRYGTVPIVRATGGLADSVRLYDPRTGEGDGIVFRDYDETGLDWALNRALDLYHEQPSWHRMMQNGMAKDFSWEHQGSAYIELFNRLRGSA